MKNRTENFFYIIFKRVTDIIISLVLIVLLFPFAFCISLLHKMFSEGPLFYIQKRVGRYGYEFSLIKFRTMILRAEENGAQFSKDNDPRITKIGIFMRKSRIDEIPQLINVLVGDMSFIGPRPERKIFIEQLSTYIPFYKKRLLIKPGLTGLAQVKSDYADENLESHIQKLKYDMFYLENYNILLDTFVFFLTIKTVLQFKGK